MPRTEFTTLPDSARLWVFACDPAPTAASAGDLLASVDDFLDQWQAHGNPLTCARDWRDGRFLAVAVDQSSAGASGCSIDGLFRTLRAMESSMGSRFVGGGSVFFRDASGEVRCVTRDEFSSLAAGGTVSHDTHVFDASIITAEAWRDNFEVRAGESWHAALFPKRIPA
jgi:hypothetical protein